MNQPTLFDVFFDKHVGIRWMRFNGLFIISISIPGITLQINTGTYRE